MKKFIFTSFIALLAVIMGYNVYINQRLAPLSNVVLANVEALAQQTENGNGSDQTWQVGEKTIVTTTSPGWTYDAKVGVWLFEGKVTANRPPSTQSVKISCCRAKGPLSSCSYEEC
ncbi:NVEALA domain-containing protein [Bacteroides sp. UBA939]|uniref:NVEALA domain-containing protein n=1 Tax=Bacteroides sp. UBA939 TaxID=1946092 RepID=UPI0025B8ED67|nr:NVEALA domain-containing protein [Bacteroides sp. UBA939]